MNKIKYLLIFIGLTGMTLPASAQSPYPTRAVRLIVPSSPGGGTDISARILAPQLTQFLGQQVVVENRPGAGTMIGGEAVARAAPDGYTLLMGISTLAINPAMYKKVPYDALKDLAPISQAVALSNVLVIHPSLPSRNLKEFVAFARARPGQINFASAGVGTSPHLSMELFLVLANLKMLHVPYKGSGPGVTDLIAGHVPVMMPNMLSAQPHIKSGRIRALGVTGTKRAPGADDIPTIAEAGLPGYEAVQWYGVLAPAATPRDIITKLHAGVVRALQNPDVRQRLLNDGAEPVGSSPEEFAAYLRSETTKWARVIKAAGIQPE
ncbi:MAG: tripartite tricarboxylate transporter substrate binding protein [Burkholderiales bacterium]|jgi:tripartite-type tricarboxylate transporter receptor subunit TctC|nr:tripartite tricarboxylate transporter substrate binding protein [Burkholderiales bacterium]